MTDSDNKHAAPSTSNTAWSEADFEALVRAHHSALLGVAHGYVGANDADEVVQLAWIKAHKALPGYEGRARLRTWLTSIVINEARMWLRAKKRRSAHEGPADDDALEGRFDAAGSWATPPSSWSFGADELMLHQQFRECLERLLTRLPAQQRAALELRDVQETELDDVAIALETSPGNVRVLLHRGRGRLYTWIERYLATGQC